MLTVEEALRAVLKQARPLPPRPQSLAESFGAVLAEDIAADLDSPPFDKALVDGYAVRSEDLAGTARDLAVGEEITAGRTPTRPLASREAAAIMTGAPLPLGADAVVMIERTQRVGSSIRLEGPPVLPGQNLLRRGREMRAGDLVLQTGDHLTPARVGLLASVGRTRVLTHPRPRVAILPTGDELVEPDQVPGPGKIRNSNAFMLQALVESCQAHAQRMPIALDEPPALQELLKQGLEADVLVITGGVSAGNRDLVPEALERLRVTRVFHKVRLKPGKPLWFGVGPARLDGPGTLVFGLPGNPVSGLVGFQLFVRPALDALAGRQPCADGLTRLPLAISFQHSGDRPTYHPAQCRDGRVEPLLWAGSADLRTMARADGLAVFPAGDRSYNAGEVVGFLRLG